MPIGPGHGWLQVTKTISYHPQNQENQESLGVQALWVLQKDTAIHIRNWFCIGLVMGYLALLGGIVTVDVLLARASIAQSVP